MTHSAIIRTTGTTCDILAHELRQVIESNVYDDPEVLGHMRELLDALKSKTIITIHIQD